MSRWSITLETLQIGVSLSLTVHNHQNMTVCVYGKWETNKLSMRRLEAYIYIYQKGGRFLNGTMSFFKFRAAQTQTKSGRSSGTRRAALGTFPRVSLDVRFRKINLARPRVALDDNASDHLFNFFLICAPAAARRHCRAVLFHYIPTIQFIADRFWIVSWRRAATLRHLSPILNPFKIFAESHSYILLLLLFSRRRFSC